MLNKSEGNIGIAQKKIIETPIEKHPTATQGLKRSPESQTSKSSRQIIMHCFNWQ